MGILVLAFLPILAAIAYAISLKINPWTPCKRCNGSGKKFDPVFRGAHRACSKCSGSGHKPRFGRRFIGGT